VLLWRTAVRLLVRAGWHGGRRSCWRSAWAVSWALCGQPCPAMRCHQLMPSKRLRRRPAVRPYPDWPNHSAAAIGSAAGSRGGAKTPGPRWSRPAGPHRRSQSTPWKPARFPVP